MRLPKSELQKLVQKALSSRVYPEKIPKVPRVFRMELIKRIEIKITSAYIVWQSQKETRVPLNSGTVIDGKYQSFSDVYNLGFDLKEEEKRVLQRAHKRRHRK